MGEKMIFWTFSKFETSALWKALLRDEKTSHRLGENICKHISDKSLVCRIPEEYS